MKTCLIIALVFIAVFTIHAQTPSSTQVLQTVKDPELSDYLTRLANNVVARTTTSITCTVVVIDDDDLNAFAQPSGELYLTRGLINAVTNEAELVFVMAQQLSYLNPQAPAPYQQRDLKKPRIGHTLMIGVLSGAMIAYGGPVGMKVGAMIIAQEVGSRSRPRPSYSSIQTVSPTFILEADKFAIDYLNKAGYDPEAALTLLEKLRSLRSKNYVKQSQLASPPVTFLERLRVVRNRIVKLERKEEYLLDSSTFKELKKRLEVQPKSEPQDSLKPKTSSSSSR